MSLVRIFSRSSSAAFRAVRAQPLLVNGYRRQFWGGSVRVQERPEDDIMNLINPKLTAALEEPKQLQEVVKPPSTFNFAIKEEKKSEECRTSSGDIFIRDGHLRLRRAFEEDDIEVIVTRAKDGDLRCCVTIQRDSYWWNTKMDLVVELTSSMDLENFDINSLSFLEPSFSPIEGRKLDRDLKDGLMKYLKLRGIHRDNMEYVIKYIKAHGIIN